MAKDFIHLVVKEALQKEGWQILKDPLTVELPDDPTYLAIDLSAAKVDADGRLHNISAIEIKSFLENSIIYAFHEALGQYLNYRAALDEQGDHDMELYLAVSEEGWERLNQLNFIGRRIQQFSLQFIIVNTKTKEVLSWIK